jgi:hypothetical protein
VACRCRAAERGPGALRAGSGHKLKARRHVGIAHFPCQLCTCAALSQVRAERLRQRTDDARHLRHAAILRRFWQTHGGLTLWDAGFISAATLAVVGLAYAWKLHLGQEGRPQHAQQATTAAAAAAAAT